MSSFYNEIFGSGEEYGSTLRPVGLKIGQNERTEAKSKLLHVSSWAQTSLLGNTKLGHKAILIPFLTSHFVSVRGWRTLIISFCRFYDQRRPVRFRPHNRSTDERGFHQTSNTLAIRLGRCSCSSWLELHSLSKPSNTTNNSRTSKDFPKHSPKRFLES